MKNTSKGGNFRGRNNNSSSKKDNKQPKIIGKGKDRNYKRKSDNNKEDRLYKKDS